MRTRCVAYQKRLTFAAMLDVMRKCCLSALLYLLVQPIFSQPPGGDRPPGLSAKGRIYGKALDDSTGKALEFAVVKVFEATPDSTGNKKLITGAITEGNGEFILEDIPLGTPLLLTISLLGYDDFQKEIAMNTSAGRPGSIPEKDLGNFSLKISGAALKELVIEGEVAPYRIEFDKRVYEVDKNPINAGGTAEDVLRNIPAVQVDIDGNVAVRNASPQIFVDGRPTTLTIDQIPADAIEKVEVIVNPSAKYDASGGGGGIINIVMKRNRAMGYNGSVRAGVDQRLRYNTGVDMSVRQGDFNVFFNGNYNQRKSISHGETTRDNLGENAAPDISQIQSSTNVGDMLNGKIGVDWFADIRNTFTLSQSFGRGRFNPHDTTSSVTDSLITETGEHETYGRYSDTERSFENLTSSLQFKHLFAKEGTELTADLNLSAIRSSFDGQYENLYGGDYSSLLSQEGGVKQQVYTAQSDFESVLNEKTKIEAGVRASVRQYQSQYDNFEYDDTAGEFVEVAELEVDYEFLDMVYAAYTTFSKQYDKWNYQAGLRIESSDYHGELLMQDISFRNQFPFSLFPSLFVTKEINTKQDLQFTFNRRINRPSFNQLSPFVDYSDSLNVSSGNPNLKPEFTYNGELSHQYQFNKKNTLISSLYAKYTTNQIIRYQLTTYSDVLDQDVVLSTFANADYSIASGLEVVSRNTITKSFDLTTNLNLYMSQIDGTNIGKELTNQAASFWIKMNASFKLPYNFTWQILGDYSSRKALDMGGGGGGFGGGGGGQGGGGYGGGPTNTVQGYVRPNYGVDMSLKKEFLKNKNASVTISVNDIFRTRINNVHSESEFFIQDTWRRRDQQIFRIQFSWKFGKVDTNLFRRKNNNSEGDSMEG